MHRQRLALVLEIVCGQAKEIAPMLLHIRTLPGGTILSGSHPCGDQVEIAVNVVAIHFQQDETLTCHMQNFVGDYFPYRESSAVEPDNACIESFLRRAVKILSALLEGQSCSGG